MKAVKYMLVLVLLGGFIWAEDDAAGTVTDADVSAGGEPTEDAGGATGGKDRDSTFGLSIQSVSIDGENWTRINFFPEIPIGKFGMAFDIELWLDSEGKPDWDRGWRFDNAQSALQSIFCKNYYIRWNKKKAVVQGDDHFFFKLGSLDNITMGKGILMKGYANTLDYPLDKQLGLDLALGNVGKVKFGIEAMVNNFADFSRGGPVLGTRWFINPFGKSDNVMGKLQLGISYVADINQYSALRDIDGDDVPDQIDNFPDDKRYAADTDGDTIPDELDSDVDGDNLVDWYDQGTTGSNWIDIAVSNGISVDTNGYDTDEPWELTDDQRDTFSMMAIDLILPFVNKENLNMSLYGQFAFDVDPKQDLDEGGKAKGWGMTMPGFSIESKFIDFNMEYRLSKGQFLFNYFDYGYNHKRATYNDSASRYFTRDAGIIDSLNNGIFAGLTFKIGGLVYIIWNYEHLFVSDNPIVDYRASYEGRLKLNEELLEKVPVVGGLEGFLMKTEIYDYKRFFLATPELIWGFDASIKAGENLRFVYHYEVHYIDGVTKGDDPDYDGKHPTWLKPHYQMNIGAQAVF